MREMGSFIEMQLESGKALYKEQSDIIALNSGRTAIYHAFKCIGAEYIYLPYYQCDTVRDFLLRKGVNVKYYYIDCNFEPMIKENTENSAFLLVNYYGIMSQDRMSRISKKYKNVIIDNSQAFFAKPAKNCMNVYSARKFIGVPDGAYVVGENVNRFEYEQGFSSDTAVFLLQRIEYGCEGKTYESRMKNEHRIDKEDIKRMSMLTRAILDGTNYDEIVNKRRRNFRIARDLFDGINKLNVGNFCDDDCVPMVYPLVIEDEELMDVLLKKKHFQGHWWSYLLDEVEEDSFEYYISKYVIPITIDQRYEKCDIEDIYFTVKERVNV